MFRLAIVADDLTGSMDTGVQFAKRGLRTVVSLDDRLGEGGGHGADVIVLNTNSRPDDASLAASKVRATGAYVREQGVTRVYKKIDSTLRGNIGPELDALMDAWGAAVAVLTPAFPAVGRTVVGGALLVNGVPWERTQYAEDRPEGTSLVARLIGSKRATANVAREDIARGHEALAARMRSLVAEGAGVIVADAATEGDLLTVAMAAVAAGYDQVLCGSGGMAEVLPEALALSSSEAVEVAAIPVGKPVLVVAGTVNRVTIEQVRNAGNDSGAACVEVLPPDLANNPAAEQARVESACAEALKGRQDLIIVTVPLSSDQGTTMVARDAAVASALGPVVAASLRPGDWSGMILTGGDTAVGVCAALGANTLQIEGEVEPGIPYGRLLEGKLAGQMVVTKAGGFGKPEAIANAMRFFKGRAR